ncbi:hypothetical protein NBO_559g0007 [Nosema bombycis CQ1]|uniref:Uncharacterized protein n=1 Tax=Nosema bombycis (strain CQ1 / CVCC 102059) TaxID=578461 RepID=R0MH09_NOSB1|nr:hypothetical protein NBO_559g0007 [Nosema bombycis CQ1]|eukprot:EOB12078.1 hypothetical protein NBO_559g0007 [Nosema bombycis CQ1]
MIKRILHFKNGIPFVHVLQYPNSPKTDITLISYNEFKEPSMHIRISSCVETASSHKFVFVKSTSVSDENTDRQNTLICKLIKGETTNNMTMIIVSDSNLGLIKSNLSLEFLSINSDLKRYVFQPMTFVYKEIVKILKNKEVDQAKFRSFFEKSSNFFAVVKEASVLRYKFFASENLELTYLNSDNMCFDEEKLFDSKLFLIRKISIKIITTVTDILSEMKDTGINEELLGLVEGVTTYLSCFFDKYDNLMKKNLNIQEKKFAKQMGKEDKIRHCFIFLKLYYNYQSLKADVFKLLCDYYVNFLHLKESKEVYDQLFSKICVKEIQINLLKECIEKPTIQNLTKYLTFNEFENVKVKDLQTLWIKFKKYFEMLNKEIAKQQEQNEHLAFIKLRQKNLEEQSEKLKAEIDSFIVESFHFADLFLKTNIIVYLLDNNEDVLKSLKQH